MLKATEAGDIKTAAELADRPTEVQMVALNLITRKELTQIARILMKSERSRQLVSTIYKQTLDPDGLDGSPIESMLETVLAHLFSGSISRIGRMASRIAANGTSDTRAARLLSGRLERIHAISKAGVMLDTTPPRSGEVEITTRTFDELQDDWQLTENPK